MTETAQVLLTLGALFLAGLVTDALGRRTPLPRVTLLLIFGFLVGPGGFDLLPDLVERWFHVVAHLALVMIGFLLGEKLTIGFLRQRGGEVFWISLTVVALTALTTTAGLVLLGASWAFALLLAGAATATDPAATMDVMNEVKAKGPFSDLLAGIVALDDAWGLIAFSLLLAGAQAIAGTGGAAVAILHGTREIVGAVAVGIVLGVPMAYLTGRVRPGEPTLAEALGLVFLCGGIALATGVSVLLAAMTLGFVVANLARHHQRPFHAIEGIEWPFMILFFVLAGASFRFESLGAIGGIGLAYLVLRAAGRVLGGWIGGAIAGSTPPVRNNIGLAMMPQAGVALGMALLGAERIPEVGESLLAIAVASTVLFEILGPVLTRRALARTGEARAGSAESGALVRPRARS